MLCQTVPPGELSPGAQAYPLHANRDHHVHQRGGQPPHPSDPPSHVCMWVGWICRRADGLSLPLKGVMAHLRILGVRARFWDHHFPLVHDPGWPVLALAELAHSHCLHRRGRLRPLQGFEFRWRHCRMRKNQLGRMAKKMGYVPDRASSGFLPCGWP